MNWPNYNNLYPITKAVSCFRWQFSAYPWQLINHLDVLHEPFTELLCSIQCRCSAHSLWPSLHVYIAQRKLFRSIWNSFISTTGTEMSSNLNCNRFKTSLSVIRIISSGHNLNHRTAFTFRIIHVLFLVNEDSAGLDANIMSYCFHLFLFPHPRKT